jgi:hypothetical protein
MAAGKIARVADAAEAGVEKEPKKRARTAAKVKTKDKTNSRRGFGDDMEIKVLKPDLQRNTKGKAEQRFKKLLEMKEPKTVENFVKILKGTKADLRWWQGRGRIKVE